MNISSVSTAIPVSNAQVQAFQNANAPKGEPVITSAEATSLSEQVGNFFSANSDYSLTQGKAIELLNA